ncbi:MAG: hypothetical protein GY782_04745 [Gammaproteobacteria bacterium]|nr:hypothetical protein [Gammaproteobacteria bacterium]
MKFRELMKSLVPWPFRQTGRLKICAYCGLRASAFGFPWPAAAECPIDHDDDDNLGDGQTDTNSLVLEY